MILSGKKKLSHLVTLDSLLGFLIRSHVLLQIDELIIVLYKFKRSFVQSQASGLYKVTYILWICIFS